MHKTTDYRSLRWMLPLVALLMCFAAKAEEREVLRVNGTDGTSNDYDISRIESIEFGTEDQTPQPKVGDFYYSDGTFSTQLDYSKNAIGVVFAVGDPTAEDPLLRAEHPECTHAWVVSAFGATEAAPWQTNVVAYGKNVQDWVGANLPDYLPVASYYGQDTYRNLAAGYSNTQALKKFNAANPDYTVDPVVSLEEHAAQYPTPASCSGWYVPSVKEAYMIIAGMPDNDEILAASRLTENRDVVDRKLLEIEGAKQIFDPQWAYGIWTSMEFGSNGYSVESYNCAVEGIYKDSTTGCLTRYILTF